MNHEELQSAISSGDVKILEEPVLPISGATAAEKISAEDAAVLLERLRNGDFTAEAITPKFASGQDTITATGDKVITGIGFSFQLLLIQAVLPSNTNGGACSGYAKSVADQGCTYWYGRELSPYPLTAQPHGSAIIVANAFGSHVNIAALKSVDTDGFTLDVTNLDDSIDFNYQVFGY